MAEVQEKVNLSLNSEGSMHHSDAHNRSFTEFNTRHGSTNFGPFNGTSSKLPDLKIVGNDTY